MLYVSQVSLPMRIALAGALAFAALWFVALKPRPPVADPAPPPAAAQAQDANKAALAAKPDPAAAQPAQASADRRRPRRQHRAPIDVAKAAASTCPSPPAAVLRDVESKVRHPPLLGPPRRPDYRAVRRAVEDVDRRRGKVASTPPRMKSSPTTRRSPAASPSSPRRPSSSSTAPAAPARSRADGPDELEDLVDKAIRVRPSAYCRPELAQLPRVDRRRRARQRVHPARRLRERDHVADRVEPPDDRHDAVEAERDARRAAARRAAAPRAGSRSARAPPPPMPMISSTAAGRPCR
jgi:hypothetical protein